MIIPNTSSRSLLDDFDEITAPSKPKLELSKVNPEATLAFLQSERILQAERANQTIREALNDHGASIPKCAEVLSDIIHDTKERADVRRRAVADALTLHNAMPNNKVEQAPQAIQITIQTSEHVNFANLLNPARQYQEQFSEE